MVRGILNSRRIPARDHLADVSVVIDLEDRFVDTGMIEDCRSKLS